MSDRNVQIVQQIYAAFGRGDVPGILELISDELRAFSVVSQLQDEVPWHIQVTRKQDVPRFFQALGEHVEFTRFEPRDFAVGGDHVYCTVSYDAVVRRNGVKLTVDNSMHRFTFKNGRVVEWRGTEDTAQVRAAFLA